VQLAAPVEAVSAEQLLARPSPGGADSIAFGKDNGSSLPAAELLSRASVGGADSVDFSNPGTTLSSEELLARPFPGGATTVVLGGDTSQWTTNSQVHGVGSVEAVAAAEPTVRAAPGGIDSVNFHALNSTLTAKELLARPSPGGSDTLDLNPVADPTPSSEALLARPYPGGNTTVVLGGEKSQWTTNSQIHGVGSMEAIAAAEPGVRPAPGGVDSIDFGAQPSNPSSEVLLARPQVGGATEIMLGGAHADWKTHSSTLGAGSVEAIAQAESVARPPPGGMDSVNSINAAHAAQSVAALLARPQTGGPATVVLGGDNNDWVTSSDTHGVCDMTSREVVPRQSPGGTDSVDFGKVDVSALTAEELLARPAPGGADSVHFGRVESNTLAAAELLQRPCPGGATKIVLGSDGGAWATSSQTHNGTSGVLTSDVDAARPPPGGVDSVVLGGPQDTLSAEALMTRRACGGAATVVLGADASSWSSCHNAVGVGCASVTASPATTLRGSPGVRSSPGGDDSINFVDGHKQAQMKNLKIMVPPLPGCSPTFVLGDDGIVPAVGVSANRFACGSNQNQGNWMTERSTTRLHQAPGGNSSIVLGDEACPVAHTSTSANRFASGCNQNEGNVMTDRSTTRIHQTPGGNSSLDLGDGLGSAVGKTVSSNQFANGSNQNQGNWMTDRSSTRLHQAPGGNSSINLGDTGNCPDNVGLTARRGYGQSIKVQHAPGGNSSLVLGNQGKDYIQDENVNSANVQQRPQDIVKPPSKGIINVTQAPGGTSSVMLG
jgi:hypothetical protein